MGDGFKTGGITVVGVIEGSVKGGTIASNEQWNCVSVLSEDVYYCNLLLLILLIHIKQLYLYGDCIHTQNEKQQQHQQIKINKHTYLSSYILMMFVFQLIVVHLLTFCMTPLRTRVETNSIQ